MKDNEEKLVKAEQKEKIRMRYKGMAPEQLEVIPALPPINIFDPDREMRVAVYARVSTGDPRQTSSYELQKNHYQDYVKFHPNWKLVEIYADEGISGTSLQHRDEFLRMIDDCEKGKIDLIITKSVSRFARNQLDFISHIKMLKKRKPPIGVLFESEGVNSLDPSFEMLLNILSVLAQEESHTKSEVMNSSVDMRFRHGIFLTPELFGYDLDSEGNLVINEEEAKIVKLIFFMYLYGYTSSEIASVLTKAKVKTPKGNDEWSPGSIIGILRNERHCGDILARKTWTPDYLDHRSRKNRQDRNQYRCQDHHKAIIQRADFLAVQKLIDNAKYGNKGILPELKVITEGTFTGFVTVHCKWAGFKASDYINAAKSANNGSSELSKKNKKTVNDITLSGYQVAKSQFFDISERFTVLISVSHITFSTKCTRKMENISHIDMLIDPINGFLSIRKSDKSRKSAISWISVRETGTIPKNISGKPFLKTIFDIMSWNPEYKYRLSGSYINNENGESAIIFNMREPEVLIPEKLINNADNNSIKPICSTSKSVCAYPKEWTARFGDDCNIRSDKAAHQNPQIGKEGETFISEEESTTDKSVIRRTIDSILSLIEEDNNE